MEQRRDEQPMAIDPARLAVSEELLGEGSYGRVVAVEAIVQAMGRHCGSEGVQNAGCAALWDLGRSNSDMQQRINSIGGKLERSSTGGRGTAVSVTLPLVPHR
jgi:hypothetical protein